MEVKNKTLFKNLLLVLVMVVLSSLSSFIISKSVIKEDDRTVETNNVIIQTATTTNTSLSDVHSYADLIKTFKNSVVDITASSLTAASAGSGVIIGTDDNYSYIVTNHHVIDGFSNFTVELYTGESYPATLVGSDPTGDIAVIKIEATNLCVATFIDNSDTLEVGDVAIAIGNPLGTLGGTVSKGIISAKDREINVGDETMVLLQTDAAVNSGNSGGGLFNKDGLLIGIVNAKASAAGVEGLAFAIPANKVKELATQLISTATSEHYGYIPGRSAIGATFVDAYWSENGSWGFPINRYPITYVYSLDKNGAAYKWGLREEDIIVSVSVNGEITQITSASDIDSIIKAHNIGDVLTFTIKRGGYNVQTSNINVTLEQYIYTI